MRTSLVLLLASSLPALAQQLPNLTPVDTGFGATAQGATTVASGEAQQRLLDGTPIVGLADHFFVVRAVPSEPFGTCPQSDQNPRTTDNGSFDPDLPSVPPEGDGVVNRYGGFSFSALVVPGAPGGASPAGTGEKVTRWIGKHPTELFDCNGERARLRVWMTDNQIHELAEPVGVGSVVCEVDDWAIGEGLDAKAAG
jgi:hypothetical protein